MSPSENTINILGFETSSLSQSELIRQVHGWIDGHSETRHLMALNPIKVCRARKEPHLAGYIRRADLVYPDAFGIAWAMGIFSGKKFNPIPGVELMYDLMQLANKFKLRVYLFGALQQVVEQTAKMFSSTYPDARIVGLRNGFFMNEADKSDAIGHIVSSQPDIVFVGMGALIQEECIEKIRLRAEESHTAIPVLMGVGGSFDAVTGHVPRPPRWMLRLHLEWFFRLIQQPFRAPRMIALPKFSLLVLGKKYLNLPRTKSNVQAARMSSRCWRPWRNKE